MSPRRGLGKVSNGPTIEGVFGGLLGFVPGYLVMESIFRLYPHPSHWVGALIGTGVGYGLGALIAAHKESRPPFGPGRARTPRGFRPGARPRAGSQVEREERGRSRQDRHTGG